MPCNFSSSVAVWLVAAARMGNRELGRLPTWDSCMSWYMEFFSCPRVANILAGDVLARWMEGGFGISCTG
jgi:hypothetical protein